MHEALDYNALSWVHQEIDATLQQAHAVLVEYAGDVGREDLLRDYADLMHQLRGPLQIAELAGADTLVAEIESVVTGLHHSDVIVQETTLAKLMQTMKVLPVCLSRLQTGVTDAHEVILTQVELLRSIKDSLVSFASDCVKTGQVTLPKGVFLGRKSGGSGEVAERAHAARVQFQNALLKWYRGTSGKKGVAELARVLEQLQADAGSEKEAVLWWVGAGVADALTAGLLKDSKEIKQLFGQLDRQIKRIVESGDFDFADAHTQVLLENLLNSLSGIRADDGRIAEILATYRLDDFAANQLTTIKQSGQTWHDAGPQDGVAFATDNRLGCEVNYENCAFVLVDAEHAWAPDSIDAQPKAVFVRNYQEMLREFTLAKEVIEEFSESTGSTGLLQSAAVHLEKVCDELRNNGLECEANVIASVSDFIKAKMLDAVQMPVEEELDRLADAICSVEFYLECLRDGRIFGSRIIESAENHVASLGFPVARQTTSAVEQDVAATDHVAAVNAPHENDGIHHKSPFIPALQVVDPGADPEILQIFYDESSTELRMLGELVPKLYSKPVSSGLLEEMSRAFHTLKGNARMLGANALGEFASVLDTLVNTAVNGGVSVDSAFAGLLDQSCEALSQLVEQVKDPVSVIDVDIECLVLEVVEMTHGYAVSLPAHGETVEAVAQTPCLDSGGVSDDAGLELPVLAVDADPEIVEIFIEEANEVVTVLVNTIPAWVAAPEQNDLVAEIRRCMHTLKGSGRMAGALLMGEFAWVMEDLLNRAIDGSVKTDEALYALVQKLPSVLQQLTDQVRNGTEPAANIRELMHVAKEFRSRTTDTAVKTGSETKPIECSDKPTGIIDITSESEELSVQDSQDQDLALKQIYTRECQEILETVRQYLDCDSACGMVTEPLYRGLHTLAGISESAEVESIGMLASELDKYFSNLYYTQGKLSSADFHVLRDCSEAIASLIDEATDASSEPDIVKALCKQITMLGVESEQSADKDAAESPACHQVSLSGGPETVESDAGEDVYQDDDFTSIDQELFEIFREEAAEITDACERILHAWAAAPDDHDNLIEYQRYLHTLKGSARMMNIAAIGDLSHLLETLLTRIVEATISPSPELFSALFVAQDQLTEMLEQVRQRQIPSACNSLQDVLEKLMDKPLAEQALDVESGTSKHPEKTTDPACTGKDVEPASDESQNTSKKPDAAGSVPVGIEACNIIAAGDESQQSAVTICLPPEQQHLNEQVGTRDDASDLGPASLANRECSIPLRAPVGQWPERKHKPAPKRGEPVKVQSELLDDLVNYAGEINIYRSRMETQIGDYRFNLGELEQTINRLREQLRKLEMETEAQVLYRYSQEADRQNQDFDPLELDRYSSLQESSRSLMESVSDLYSLLALMENTTRDSETLLLQQSRVSADLHEGLMNTRMIPFSGLETRLKRIVRQSARQLDKKVELVLHGADGEMDRAVIERIIAPLEHMLRNAVAHGIEKPGDRVGKGKAETGIITIAFGREGPDIVLQISDDGAGMDVNAIREKAVEKGLLDSDADIPDSDVTQFVLQTGFSTASEVTQISGRGVGLDVVNSEVKQLGGSLHMESEQGAGTVFTIRLPYTLAINQALLVMAGADTYCVPLGNIEGVVRVHPEELLGAYATENPVYDYAGNRYQLKHLATLLNTGQLDASQRCARIPLLLMRVADRRIALHVESLLGSREIVIKPLGAQLNSIDGISGATILGDGGVAMILDVFALSRSNIRTHVPVMRMVSRDEKRLVVMVVDDSITVRKVTTRLLERTGYKVLTAKDGVDATGQLQGCTPDIMLLDVEMPRMDGFELATHMRNDDRLRHVPIVMITSRTGEKHRERARQIGVRYYLGKPYQENDLLATIDQIIRVAPDSHAMNRAEA